MERKFTIKDVMVTGFALFAMFLGAGNLIFPPNIGIHAGRLYPIATLGFLFTGIAMPLLGIIATTNTKGSMLNFTGIVSKNFALIFNTLILMCIGPFLAIPRTAATTYEIGIAPIFGELNWGTVLGMPLSRVVVSLVYFTLTYILVLRPSKVIDIIGQYFTPVLLILLLTLIIKGIIKPIGAPGEPLVPDPFGMGFREGYQTMDAIGSFAMAGVAIMSIKAKLTDEKKIQKATIGSAIIAALGLFIVYGGFIYLGATGSIQFKDIARTEATIKLVEAIGSTFGRTLLSISMCFACLTTSIGLMTTIANTFSEMSNGKIKYKFTVTAVAIISFFLSVKGVNNIIKLSVPILSVLYPVAIVLILLNLFRHKMKRRTVFIGGAYGALVLGILYGVAAINKDLSIIQNFLYKLPLGEDGFAWVFTAIIGMVIALILDKTVLKNNEKLDIANMNLV